MAYFINSRQAQHFFNQSLKLTISSFFVKKKKLSYSKSISQNVKSILREKKELMKFRKKKNSLTEQKSQKPIV